MTSQWILDTCAVLPSGKIGEFNIHDVEHAQRRITLFEEMNAQGEIYCVPEVLEELEAASSYIEQKIKTFHYNEKAEKYCQDLRNVRNQCEQGLFNWKDVRGDEKTVARYVHHWTRSHNQHLEKGRLGGHLETDRHLMTALAVLGMRGEATLVTRDRQLEITCMHTIPEIISGGVMEEYFPHKLYIYWPRNDEAIQRERRVQIPISIGDYVKQNGALKFVKY